MLLNFAYADFEEQRQNFEKVIAFGIKKQMYRLSLKDTF